MIALSGVRSSWLMFARNSLLCRLAAASSWFAFSSCPDFVWISLNSRTFSIATTAWAANVSSEPISRPLNGRLSKRRRLIVPMATPSRRSGATTTA